MQSWSGAAFRDRDVRFGHTKGRASLCLFLRELDTNTTQLRKPLVIIIVDGGILS